MPSILPFWFLVYSLYYLTLKVSVELNLAKWNICPKPFCSISFNPYLLVLITIYLLYQRDRLKIPQNSYRFLYDTMKRQNPNFPIFFPNLITVFPPFANHVSYIFPPFCLHFFKSFGGGGGDVNFYLKHLPKIFRQRLLNRWSGQHSEFVILLSLPGGWNLFPSMMVFGKGNQKCYLTPPSSLKKILDLPEGL